MAMKNPIHPGAAYRLSQAFGFTPETWLGMQLAFDLVESRNLDRKINVKRVQVT